MGMYTSVVRKNGCTDVQIKTGHDFCECYRIGDPVNWQFDTECVGRYYVLADGVYSYCDLNNTEGVVIIKDHKILDILDYSIPSTGKYQDLEYWAKYRDWCIDIAKQHEIEDFDPYDQKHYSKEVWDAFIEFKNELERQWGVYAAENDFDNKGDEKFGLAYKFVLKDEYQESDYRGFVWKHIIDKARK